MATLAEALESDLPLWLLDVDGVINCWPAPMFGQLMSSQEWNDAVVGKYKIWWRRPVVDLINAVYDEGLVQPVWLTTWAESAAEDLAPALGLRDFPAVTNMSGDLHPTSEWWKWARFKEIVPQGSKRKIVWTDDQLTGVVRGFASSRQSALLINPMSNPGLEDEHLAAIYRFLTHGERSPR